MMRKLFLLSLVLGAVSVLVGYLGLRLSAVKQAARQAASDLQACERLADKITILSTSPRKALKEHRSLDDLSARIEQAAAAAKLEKGVVTRILPQADRRLGESSYVAQPTRLECREIALREFVFFLHELLSGDTALHATTIRLSLPQMAGDEERDEAWNVELVLTHVLYSPNPSAK